MIQNAEIEAPFLGLNLLPRDRHQDRVHMQPGHIRHNPVRFRRGARRGIPEFATPYQERASIDNEFSGSILHLDMWRFSRPHIHIRDRNKMQGDQTNESGTRR